MTELPEKLDLASADIAVEKREEILSLFPEARTEGGKIDFDTLKRVLGETVDPGKERYGMTWPGKAECFKTIQRPSLATLLPAPDESVNFETTENLIIEGDNLEVLKLLQKSYLGKVKMIYIDPPYNTGNDFIYPDNYSESLQTYLEYTGQVDAEGKKFSTNTEADGRFHSKWLNMMYPRLYLARNLLREDGAIFVSCDDHESHGLRSIMNELFGEESFVAQITVVNNLKGRNDRKFIASAHDYLLMYARSDFESLGLPLTSKQLSEYRQQDEEGQRFQWRDLRKRGGADTRKQRPKLYFPVYVEPSTGDCSLDKSERFSVEVFPTKSDGTEGCWRWGRARVKAAVAELRASRLDSKNRWNIAYRVYLEQDGEVRVAKPKSVWFGPELSTDSATKALKAILPGVPDITPKPLELIKTILYQGLDDGDLVLDFFAGSGTTGHATLELNRQDGGSRRYMLVQLPEPTGHDVYPTIADITKQRLRKSVAAMTAEDGCQDQDRGFRVFKLAESNFKPWNAEAPKDGTQLTAQLELHVDHVRDGRTARDLLFEILLKTGFPLTTPIKTEVIEGKAVFSAADGALLVCLERGLTLELIRALAERKPERVVCLDAGFANNDPLKANAVQIFRTAGVTSFKTV